MTEPKPITDPRVQDARVKDARVRDTRTHRRALRVALTTSLLLAVPAWAGEGSDGISEELEVTLEVFDDSESLEAFELRLTDIDGQRAGDAPGDDLMERVARFDDEVREASDADGNDVPDRRNEEREAEATREQALADEHDENRIERLAEFDEADDMEELDLAEPEDEETAPDGEMPAEEPAADGEVVMDRPDELLEDGPMDEADADDSMLSDESEETDELAEEEPPAGGADDLVS